MTAELGIVTNGRIYIYDCPLSDIKETYDEIDGRNIATLKEHRLYDDGTGHLHVFYSKEPPKKCREPWFTIRINSDNEPRFVFSQNRYSDMESLFQKENLGDISVMTAMNDIPDQPIKYSEAVEKSMTRAGAIYRPNIKLKDDFLKKLTKSHIILTGVDVKTEFRSKMKTQYQLSNAIQSLDGTSKQNPLAFAEWADWNGLEFEIRMRDNPDLEKIRMLGGELIYDSSTNTIKFRKDGVEYECVKFDGTVGEIMEAHPIEDDEIEEEEFDASAYSEDDEFDFE